MDNGKWATYWRIATGLSGLARGFFVALGLPPPDLPDFKPYTQLTPQSQGALSEQGYQNITILWDQMTGLQIRTLQNILDNATNNTVWATIDRAHGFGMVNDFVDISGIAQPLQYDNIPKARGVVFSNVRLTITNITIINDPSNIFN